MSYYQRHLFFCCNQRADDAERPCCAAVGAQQARDYAKQRVKQLALAGAGKVRINLAGCLDRCEEGPVLVVYPDAVWYTYVDHEDIDEIIDEHVLHGRPVKRLMI
jgi:(2Fe-2S) ferredoxin